MKDSRKLASIRGSFIKECARVMPLGRYAGKLGAGALSLSGAFW